MSSDLQSEQFVEASDVVSIQLRNKSRVLNHMDRAQQMLSQLATISDTGTTAPHPALVEFHPTDVCDLDCTFCTYNDRVSESFPWEALEKFRDLQPRAIVLAGGGEPVLYRSQGKRFADLVLRLAELLPDTKIGLITNGALFPGEEAASKLAWVRVSIDAGTSQIYDLTKNRAGGSPLDSRLDNLVQFAQAGVEFVGAGYVFHRFNIHQLADFLKLAFDRFETVSASFSNRVNLQFRAACGIQSCDCPSDNYSEATGRLMTPDLTSSWSDHRKQQTDTVLEMMEVNPQFKVFVRGQTNFFGDEVHRPVKKVAAFDKCYLSLVRILVRANGDVFPCVMKASQRHNAAGNLVQSSPTMLWKGLREYYNLDTNRCRGQKDCCNIDGIKNVMLETEFHNSPILPGVESTFQVQDDPFF